MGHIAIAIYFIRCNFRWAKLQNDALGNGAVVKKFVAAVDGLVGVVFFRCPRNSLDADAPKYSRKMRPQQG